MHTASAFTFHNFASASKFWKISKDWKGKYREDKSKFLFNHLYSHNSLHNNAFDLARALFDWNISTWKDKK